MICRPTRYHIYRKKITFTK